MMKKFHAATALVAALTAVPASAATVMVRFTGTFDNVGGNNPNRNYFADVTLEVNNGMASSGTGTFTFQGVTRDLGLVTVDTPGNHNIDPNYPVGLISNGGDNVFGADQIYPLTSVGGLLFAIDTTVPVDREFTLINFFNDGGTLRVGAFGTLVDGPRLYTYGSLVVSAQPPVTPAVPEPATWAMMLVGFGMVGAASRYRRRGTKVTYA